MQDDSTPATRGDLRKLHLELLAEMRAEIRAESKSIHESIDQVLAVLVNIDKRLTSSVADHEKRIHRLERHMLAV